MTKRVLAYCLTGHDNDSYMLGEETRKAATAEERAQNRGQTTVFTGK